MLTHMTGLLLTNKRVFWLYGLSGAGKTTIANAAASELRERSQPVLIIDGDDLRAGLCRELGFGRKDRIENVRRAAEIAKIASEQGYIVLSALMTPHNEMRGLARSIVGVNWFCEVYVSCKLATCVSRDPKGLYAMAYRGAVQHMPGKDFDFEEPIRPDLLIDTDNNSLRSCVEVLVQEILCK